MKHQHNLIMMLGYLMAFGGFTANVRAQSAEQKPVKHLVSTYHVAPGQHLQFLKWFAQQEAVDKEAGAPAAQWFAHQDGASWDYIVIAVQPEAAEQEKIGKKFDKLAKKKGMATGMRASLEFRQFISSHSDTYALGPFTAEELVKEAEKRD